MTKEAVRIFLEQQTPANPPLNYSFDVLIEGETIVPKVYYFGLRGFYRGGPSEPALLSPDGTIDFGSDWGDDDRWERTNLFRKRIHIGEIVSFWVGTDELPKSKDDEWFYVIRNVTAWGEQADRPAQRHRSEIPAAKVAKSISKPNRKAKPAPRRATIPKKRPKQDHKAKAKRSAK